jgi:hypothetical protein
VIVFALFYFRYEFPEVSVYAQCLVVGHFNHYHFQFVATVYRFRTWNYHSANEAHLGLFAINARAGSIAGIDFFVNGDPEGAVEIEAGNPAFKPIGDSK